LGISASLYSPVTVTKNITIQKSKLASTISQIKSGTIFPKLSIIKS